jgi:glycosyltransferase involved in cell wall biosynthesis
MTSILKGQMKFISNYFDVIAVTSKYDEYFDEIFSRENVKVVDLKMHRKISVFSDLISLAKMILLIWRQKPTIVHSQTPKAGLLAMSASWILGVPVRIHSVVGVPVYADEKGLRRLILFACEKLTLFFANEVFPNSNGVKDFVIANKLCDSTKIAIVAKGSSNGIDVNHFSRLHYDYTVFDSIRNELNFDKDDFVFCFVGRICIAKGISELVNAFGSLKSDFADRAIKLLLIGPYFKNDDPIDDVSYSTICNHEDIKYIGLKKEIRPYLFASNCFVFPTYREGLPNVLLQASAMEMPIIATNVVGCNDIITNESNGLLVEPKNVNELKQAMIRCYLDQDLCIKLSGNSRELIVEKYSQNYYWGELKKMYEFQLSKRGIR